MPLTEYLKHYTSDQIKMLRMLRVAADGTVDLESREDQLKGTFKTHNIQELCLQEIKDHKIPHSACNQERKHYKHKIRCSTFSLKLYISLIKPILSVKRISA